MRQCIKITKQMQKNILKGAYMISSFKNMDKAEGKILNPTTKHSTNYPIDNLIVLCYAPPNRVNIKKNEGADLRDWKQRWD